jgi:HSP20 family molecular chaperone IbpA
MFKIFKGENHDNEDESHGPTSIEVKMEEDDIVEEELGQVALDILDCPDMIVIIAPVAGIDTENVDISVSRNILTISGERERPDIYNSSDRILVEECFY